MTRIVTSTYRYKRPPRKKKAVPMELPTIVRKGAAKPETPPAPANDPTGVDPKSAIVTAKRRRSKFGDVPDMTPEEHQRRGDAAVRCSAIWCAGPPNDRPADPERHWRSYGTDPLPTGREALDEPFRAFPSWFMRITCDRCGKDRMLNEAHMKRSDMPIRDIIARMRHDGCGGRAGKVELLTGIEGASSRPVRRIVLVEG